MSCPCREMQSQADKVAITSCERSELLMSHLWSESNVVARMDESLRTCLYKIGRSFFLAHSHKKESHCEEKYLVS